MSDPQVEIQEYPKWIEPHESHIVRKEAESSAFVDPVTGEHKNIVSPPHVSTPAWDEFHVDRLTGAVTVLVHDAEQEAKALAALAEEKAEEKPEEQKLEPEKVEPPPPEPIYDAPHHEEPAPTKNPGVGR